MPGPGLAVRTPADLCDHHISQRGQVHPAQDHRQRPQQEPGAPDQGDHPGGRL